MKDSPRIKQELAAVSSLQQRAEQCIKRAECVDGRLIVPAINDLRHAGRHLAMALDSDDEELVLTELALAKASAQRAITDAQECVALFSLRKFEDIKDKIHFVDLGAKIPAYSDARRVAGELVSLLKERGARGPEDEARLEKVEDLSHRLAELLREIEASSDTINKLRRAARRRAQIYILASLFGLIVSVATYVSNNLKRGSGIQDATMSNEIADLTGIGKSLSALQGYVADQKLGLERMRSDVESLRAEKNQLDQAVSIKRELVDALLARAQQVSARKYSIDLAVSFLVGLFSSLFATQLHGFLSRRRRGLYS